MRILDRYVLRSFLVSYLIMAFVLIGLYTVIDLTLNSDEFTKARRDEPAKTVGRVLGDMAGYYGPQMFVYFNQLSGIITLVAAVVTLTTMNRRNEMTAILASGVSLYRVIWLVIVLGVVFNALGVADQELVIPRLADRLVRKQDEVSTLKQFRIHFYEMQGAWSDEDRFVVGRVALDGARAELVPRPGGLTAIRQLRAGDKLAVHAADTGLVRVYLKARPLDGAAWPRPDHAGAKPGEPVATRTRPVDLYSQFVPVEPVDLASMNRLDLPAPTDGTDLSAIAPGDFVVPVYPPKYLFFVPSFRPEDKPLNMKDAEIFKVHYGDPAAPSFEALARIRAKLLTWDPQASAWIVPVDEHDRPKATVISLMTSSEGAEFRRQPPEQPCAIRAIHTNSTPQELILRHSSKYWMQFMSTVELRELVANRAAGADAQVRPVIHIRFIRPAINMILLLLGVPFVLSRTPGNLWHGILRCVLISGSCFVLAFVCEQLAGDAKQLAVVAAWLPVLLYGPPAVLMLDSVKT